MQEVEELVQGVWQLYAPLPWEQHSADIVLFHGLQLGSRDVEYAWQRTWLCRPARRSRCCAGGTGSADSAGTCWPAVWLPQDFPTARVLSVSYNTAAAAGIEKGQSLEEIAAGVLDNLVHADVDVGKQPLILVRGPMGREVGGRG